MKQRNPQEQLAQTSTADSVTKSNKAEWPGVRWDRLLQTAMERQVAVGPIPTSTDRSLEPTMKRYIKRRAKEILRGPASRVRDFMNAPVHMRLEATSASQKKLISEQSERISEQAVCMSEQAERISEQTGRLDKLGIKIASVETLIGFLHQKTDEAAIKSRPVVHLDGAYAVPLADGYIFIPEGEENLLLMYTGAGSTGIEPGTRRILQAALDIGDHAIDVGASVGLHTLAMAKAVRATGRVDAFEAEPRLESYLRRSLAVNGLNHVALHPHAVGAQEATATFHISKTIGHSSLYELNGDDQEHEAVPLLVRPLDEAIDTFARVKLIKIDVEGAELDVIRGAKRVLDNSPDCSIVAECGPSHLLRTGVSVEEWFSEFASLGFAAHAIEEPSGNLRRLEMDWMSSQESVNVLFVRPNGDSWKTILDRLDLSV